MQKLYSQQSGGDPSQGVNFSGTPPEGFSQEFAKEAFARAEAEKNKTNVDEVD
jgi:hypothetical protein